MTGIQDRPAIATHNLAKYFDRKVAVNHISFEVRQGEIFALLGPNGAGKSTTMKILSTLAAPSAGRAEVAGFDVARESREVRRRIGLVFQEPTLDRQLSLQENLRCHAVLYGVPRKEVATRVQYALDLVGLTPYRAERASRLSGGMSRRLEIGRAMLHQPQVLFLDEPTVGLDPPNRTRVWSEVRRLRGATGMTVLMTTHYMDEAEHADRIAIIAGGEIVAIDTPANLKSAVGLDRIKLRTADNQATVTALKEGGISAWIEEDAIVVHLPNAEHEVSRLLSLIDSPISFVNVQRPTLDDVFLHFTEESLTAVPTTDPSSHKSGVTPTPGRRPKAITQHGRTSG